MGKPPLNTAGSSARSADHMEMLMHRTLNPKRVGKMVARGGTDVLKGRSKRPSNWQKFESTCVSGPKETLFGTYISFNHRGVASVESL